MVKFETLTVKNFLSFGAVPTTLNLDSSGTTLILGEDLDNTESGSGGNGCGKTSLLNALTYGIYDKAISDISKDNLVNNINKKNMEVTVTFIKNGVRYTVKRFRKAKAGAAGNYVQFFENDKDITPDSIGNTNKLIESIMGIPYEIFVRVVAFSATLTPFLDLPVSSHYAANQTDIIEELFDLKSLSEKALALKEIIKDTEQSLSIYKAKSEQHQQELKRHGDQVTSAERRVEKWNIDNEKEIKSIAGKLKKIEKVDIKAEQDLSEELKVVSSDVRAVTRSMNDTMDKIKRATKKKNDKNKELTHLKEDQCPYCLQSYVDAEDGAKKCEAEVEILLKEIDELSDALIVEDDKCEVLTSTEKELKSKITITNIDELLEIQSKTSVYQTKLKELEKAINPFVEPMQELYDIEFDDSDLIEKTNELDTLINHQKFLLKLLTKKDSFVRKTLLNKNIPFLNGRLKEYLTDLGLPHTVEFTHEMTAEISQFGREMGFGNLSNGQRARVNLALSFAFRDVLQYRTDKINVCMLDEVLDVGLDTVGVQNAARMIKRKARTEELALFIISHRDEVDSAFDNTMTVQMKDGFSNIKIEE